MLKKAIVCAGVTAAMILGNVACRADVWVRGHIRHDGTYVQPHYRSSPDRSFWNNWSTYPNINPYTWRLGTRTTPYFGGRSYSYGGYSLPSYPSLPRYGSSFRLDGFNW
jgi:hypothetical protein